MKSVFITGASSGIGKSLAMVYAMNGYIIGLASRNQSAIKEVAKKCESQGGKAFVYELDVTKPNNCALVAEKFIEDADGVDIVIANAGIGGDDQITSGSSKSINKIIDTDLLGVTNTVMPFIPHMKNSEKGTLVCISSVAGFIPLPHHGGYVGSKIAIRYIFDSWRITLEEYNIKLITICPGFIDTPMVKGPARKLPMKSSSEAAKKFFIFIKEGKGTYIYPFYYKIFIKFVKLLPKRFYNWAVQSIYSKNKNETKN